MTRNEITRRFPKASEAFIRANLDVDSSRQDAVVECAARNEPLAQNQSEEGAASRVLIRFISVRKRLLDPDNLSEKWLLDCLRYCGVIRGDEPEKISLETSQRKVIKGEIEHTLIEVIDL